MSEFIEESSGGGVPEWIVTYGDMMSLLLTFFIMLVSMSEVKEKERYQAMVDSIRQQFGYDQSTVSLLPGDSRSHNSRLPKLATLGRAKRKHLMTGGDKTPAPSGENPRVRNVRPGAATVVGSVIYFGELATDLTPEHKADLDLLMERVRGKPQKVEIRGHSTRRPPPPESGLKDAWDLAYHRGRNVLTYLVDEAGLEPERARLAVAGPHEPLSIEADPAKIKLNARVEILLLEEVAGDLSGDPDEQRRRIVSP